MEEFQFKIGLARDEDLSPADPSASPRVALVRDQLQALLEVVILTKDGAEVAVDGFRFIGESASHALWPPTG